MSAVSEEAYSAGWMTGLEYGLWAAVLGVPYEGLHLDVSAGMRAYLLVLSDACGGWIVFDDTTEETWLPRAEWEHRFADRRA